MECILRSRRRGSPFPGEGLGTKIYDAAFQDLALSKILTSLLKLQPLQGQLLQPATLGEDIPTMILYEPVTFFRHRPHCVKVHSLSLRLLPLVDTHCRFPTFATSPASSVNLLLISAPYSVLNLYVCPKPTQTFFLPLANYLNIPTF